jgi:hypothetical protein
MLDQGVGCNGEGETADDPVHDFHMKTFLEMTESLDKIRQISEYDALQKTHNVEEPFFLIAGEADKDLLQTRGAVEIQNTTHVTAHASVMYYGDRLALSTETVKLAISERDYKLFCRVVDCFTKMVMGTYSEEDVQRLRDDHDYLLSRWDSNNAGYVETKNLSADDPRRAACDEIHKMIKKMLETPVYYTSSCMALIACGKMLRHLFETTHNREAIDFNDLLCFVRQHMRHNPVYPFECECKPEDGCSDAYKTLLSLILELPPIIHNQTYMLQILAYLMFDKEGREEIFIINMKNVVSPGLLDKIPTRLAMLVGSLDENTIRSRMKNLRKDTAGLIAVTNGISGHGNKAYRLLNGTTTQYNRMVLENLVSLVHSPRIAQLINTLPGVENATVEMTFARCKDKRICLNADNTNDINTPKYNNYGKHRCCGYLKLDPTNMLASSISILQLCVYLYTDTHQAPARSQRHFFIRDILLAMAKCSMNIDDAALEDIFGYLDRCDVFKGFVHNPIFTATFYKLFQSYLKSMKSMANQFQKNRRKINRAMEKISNS